MFKGNKGNFGKGQLALIEERKLLPHLRTPDEILDNLEEDNLVGGKVYNRYCATCHQRNGKGDENRFPPLVGSDWVGGDKGRLIDVVLNGLQGKIEVSGIAYNNLMPAFQYLDDKQVAVILTYIRQNFGNEVDEVSEAEVRVRRQLP